MHHAEKILLLQPLTFGGDYLVTIPVEIHSATKSGARVSFNQIHGPSGQRVRYTKSVDGVGPIENADIVKGYELENNEYLLIEPADLASIKMEANKTFDLVQFVKKCEIPPLYYDKPYYVIPSDDRGQEAYRVVRDALRKSETVGLGQMIMRGQEYLCSIEACGDGLLMGTLFYADEVAQADPLFQHVADATVDDDLLDIAKQLIERKAAPFNPEAFTDRYDVAVRELIEAKKSNAKTPRTRAGKSGPAPTTNVVDLKAALEASLKDAGGKAALSKARRDRVQKTIRSDAGIGKPRNKAGSTRNKAVGGKPTSKTTSSRS
jgi:DNA end-binding protein Ku